MCLSVWIQTYYELPVSNNRLQSMAAVVIASPYHVPLLVKNTFLHFDIDRFEMQGSSRKRAASAPPATNFSAETKSPAPLRTKKKQRMSKNKIDVDSVLNEFAHLARAECWGVLGKKLIARQERVADLWGQINIRLLEVAPIKKMKRFTLTKRQFFNAAPWVNPTELLCARRIGLLRPSEPDSMEFWASDAELLSKPIATLFTIFVQFLNMMEREQMMLMLPCGTTFLFAFRPDMHVDNLKAKVKEEFQTPFDKQRLICLGQELKGGGVLGDYDIRPGDVISVLFA